MRIAPQLNPDKSLKLTAWSFSQRELDSLRSVLKESGISATEIFVPPDKRGRTAIAFTIQKADVARLEKELGVTFFESIAGRTMTKLTGQQQGYQCQEITLRGDGKGCVNISATSQNDATVKCSLVANNRRWFGGTASPGACKTSARHSHVPQLLKRIFGNED
jgi:hypothetical protein